MAQKNGLNRKEQIQCAQWLTEGIPAAEIAKKFHTSSVVVRKFTQERLDAATAKSSARLTDQNLMAQKRKAKAAVLKEAIKTTKEDFI